jgi:hypothetical protein
MVVETMGKIGYKKKLSVKATDRSVEKTVFGRLQRKPNFPVA